MNPFLPKVDPKPDPSSSSKLCSAFPEVPILYRDPAADPWRFDPNDSADAMEIVRVEAVPRKK